MSLRAMHEASKSQTSSGNEQIEQIQKILDCNSKMNDEIQRLRFEKSNLLRKLQKKSDEIVKLNEHIATLNKSDLIVKDNEKLNEENKKIKRNMEDLAYKTSKREKEQDEREEKQDAREKELDERKSKLDEEVKEKAESLYSKKKDRLHAVIASAAIYSTMATVFTAIKSKWFVEDIAEIGRLLWAGICWLAKAIASLPLWGSIPLGIIIIGLALLLILAGVSAVWMKYEDEGIDALVNGYSMGMLVIIAIAIWFGEGAAEEGVNIAVYIVLAYIFIFIPGKLVWDKATSE